MQTLNSSVDEAKTNAQTIAIAATFTAEPIADSLMFWIEKLDFPTTVEFAPYNQIFQQLLDPSSLLYRNQNGVNLILIRLEDWQRYDEDLGLGSQPHSKIERNIDDLIQALRSAVARTATPYLICLCPASPTIQNDHLRTAFFEQSSARLKTELSHLSNLYWLENEELQTYLVPDYYDAKRDELGHIPYTPVFFTALGTAIARKIYSIKSPPTKVIVLDCDNTLWKGVVGEDGVAGIDLSGNWQKLQETIVAQQQAGLLICLCSKNNEADVVEVFEQRRDFTLKREHIVSWRINWLPKSENIKSLASELNLGLDSFIFIDDNPVECAEVQANCPEVLTLQLPTEAEIPRFLSHVWAFDRLKVTQEDKQRTALYKQNLERDRFAKEALTIDDFLAGLALNVEISEPTSTQLPRVAQLTQRTNQFNLTTRRRSESEIQHLADVGLECRIVEVSDRFGDYGLVGVMLFSTTETAIEVDTFLLSCRVLGRGVEQRMLAHLAEIAKEQGLSQVNLLYLPTAKNQPALNFLSSFADFKQPQDNGDCFCLPVEFAAAVSYKPQANGIPEPDVKLKANLTKGETLKPQKSARMSQIVNELNDPAQIHDQIESQRSYSVNQQPFIAPRNDLEKSLTQLWEKILRIEPIGIQDNYFDLGGTSLQAVEVIAEIETQLAKKLPLTAIVEAPTIEQLALLIPDEPEKVRTSLVLLQKGTIQPPLFLIHDGDGETLLYRNLAQQLGDRASVPQGNRSIYGIQPLNRDGYPILHTRLEDMAAYYIEQIRTVQPTGTYLVGGMCAGGVLAFAVAQELQNQGEKVALVALIDAADVQAPLRVGRIASARLNNFSQTFQNQQLRSQERLFYILNKVSQKVFNLIAYETSTKIKTLQATVKLRLFQYYLDKKLPLPSFLQNISVRTAYLFAEKQYSPKTQYQGEVVLFRATEGEGDNIPYIEVYSDPLLGWEKRVTGGVKVYDIPGGHASMLQEPNVQVMAEKMQAYINEQLSK